MGVYQGGIRSKGEVRSSLAYAGDLLSSSLLEVLPGLYG